MPNSLTIRGAKGDMLKSIYDTDKDGSVDNSQKLEQETKSQVQDHTPKSHTHEESQISDLDHDAQKIKGVIIDDTDKGDQKVLAYDLATQNIVYITQAPAGAILNSIQYGSITISGTDFTDTATISSVDTSKAIVFCLGFYGTSGAADANCSILDLLNATTVRATRHNFVSSQSMTINFCVLEFSDGIASVQQDTVTIYQESIQADKTISEVDISKAVLFFLGFTTDYQDCEWGDLYPRIAFLNSTTVRAIRNLDLYETQTAFAVLEFS